MNKRVVLILLYCLFFVVYLSVLIVTIIIVIQMITNNILTIDNIFKIIFVAIPFLIIGWNICLGFIKDIKAKKRHITGR